MKRSEKAERIQQMLESLYPETPVPLDHESSFQLLVAVLMSAQTTDLKVNEVTPELFRQGPTPEKMADLKVEQIDVVVHPQSIIHSAVQFEDGSIKAQLGVPDMKLPIQYALGFPKRLPNTFKRFSFMDYPNLTFEKPDLETFRNLQLAYDCMQKGGNMPCILNAANEIAVAAFLQDKIGFLNMSDLIANCMEKITFVSKPTLTDYVATDEATRILANELL